ALERGDAEQGVDEARVAFGIGGDERGGVAEQAGDRALELRQAPGQQRPLERVEAAKRPRLTIGREVELEQPAVDKGLAQLVLEVRPDDPVEEGSVAKVQKQVQLVAG